MAADFRPVNLLLPIRQAVGGVVLVDEVENSLHLGNLDQLGTAPDRSAQSTNAQVTGATHSAECLQTAARMFGRRSAGGSNPSEVR